jgi:hypothetical protein
MSRTVFLMWDCYGLETAFSTSDIEQNRMWAMLKGEDLNKIPMPLPIAVLKIRARANIHRGYELYLVETTDDISVDDIIKAFEDAPQEMAERIRKIGHKICDYRQRNDDRVRIT